jgi:hypothetical protein
MARRGTAEWYRSKGVPEDVIEHRLSRHRVVDAPLVGVEVTNPSGVRTRVPDVPESDEVIRERMRQKVAMARRRFRRRT